MIFYEIIYKTDDGGNGDGEDDWDLVGWNIMPCFYPKKL